MSFIKLLIDDLNKNDDQNINNNILTKKINERQKFKRMLSHIKKNVLLLIIINYFKFIQKFELKINLIKKNCFIKIL